MKYDIPGLLAMAAETSGLRADLREMDQEIIGLRDILESIFVEVIPAIADAAVIGDTYSPEDILGAVKQLCAENKRLAAELELERRKDHAYNSYVTGFEDAEKQHDDESLEERIRWWLKHRDFTMNATSRTWLRAAADELRDARSERADAEAGIVNLTKLVVELTNELDEFRDGEDELLKLLQRTEFALEGKQSVIAQLRDELKHAIAERENVWKAFRFLRDDLHKTQDEKERWKGWYQTAERQGDKYLDKVLEMLKEVDDLHIENKRLLDRVINLEGYKRSTELDKQTEES